MKMNGLKFVVMLFMFLLPACGGGNGENPPVTTATVTLAADRNEAVANGNDYITLTATVTDTAGAPIALQNVIFNIPHRLSPYASPIGYIGHTDNTGRATISVNSQPLGPNHTEVMDISVTCEGVTSNAVTVSFNNPPQQIPATVALTVDKSSFSADGIDKVNFKVTATDSGGSPIAGQVFEINITSVGIPMGGVGDSFTNAVGQARMSLQCAERQTGMVVPVVLTATATINGLVSNAISITITPP